jgi:hypothetical protein
MFVLFTVGHVAVSFTTTNNHTASFTYCNFGAMI